MIDILGIGSMVGYHLAKWHKRWYLTWLYKNLKKKLPSPRVCDTIREFTNGPTYTNYKHHSNEVKEKFLFNQNQNQIP